jgi:HPt (histidine-containing phosphotransfer) domain-containing protein
MNNSIDVKQPFITLLAYADNKTLPVNLIDSALITPSSEQETLTLITNELFNLIIFDPDLYRLSIASLAKTSDCINSNTPLIALVEQENTEKTRHLIDSGFDDCVLKPLTSNVLNELIALWRNDSESASYLESPQTLLKIFKGNKDVILAIYDKLFEELPEQIVLISAALKKKEYDVVFNATHKIHASTKICFLRSIEDIAKGLEDCITHNNHKNAEGYFSMLQRSVDALISHRPLILDHIEKTDFIE